MLYKIRIRQKDDFDPATLESRELRKGLTGIWGKLKPEEPDPEDMAARMPSMPGMPAPAPADPPERPMRLLALHFDSDSFTLEKAFDWMNEYGYHVERLEFAAQWFAQTPPPQAGEYVTRDADLFQAGEYPDRKLTVTEVDIQRLAQTPGEIPIHVEHAGGPIKLGFVSALRATGKWLKGKLNLYPEADMLLSRLGVKGVSVAVPRALDRVLEVSATGTPRVAGARMFSGDTAEVLYFVLGQEETMDPITTTPPASTPPPATPPTPPRIASEADLQRVYLEMEAKFADQDRRQRERETALAAATQELERVRFSIRLKEIEGRVDGAIAAGQLPPIARAEALAILASDNTVRFNEQDKPVAELFAAILDKLPRQFRRPLQGAATADPAAHMTESEKEFFAKHFGDLKLEDIAKFGAPAMGGR